MYGHTNTHQQPHYPSFRQGLCLVPLESDSDLWRRGVTLHPDTHSNTKQGYRSKHAYKERLQLHQQSRTDSSAHCGPRSTPHQWNPMHEFSRSTKWMHWLLSITCFDEFHEYETLCFLTQWFSNDSSGNSRDVTLSQSLCASLQSHFLLHYRCGFVRVVNLVRLNTPWLSAQVCPPQYQAFFCLCAGMLDLLFYLLSVTAQVRTTHSYWLIMSDESTRLRFSWKYAPWLALECTQAITAGGNKFPREYFCYSATTKAFCNAQQNPFWVLVCHYSYFWWDQTATVL